MPCQIMRALTAAVAFLLMIGSAPATLIVDPPQQITKQVTVQLIRTALNGGGSPATVFGNATQRADIEAGIDSIWAQAGIDINILPTITSYNNTFAYLGNPTDYDGIGDNGKRPTGDLNTIFTNASAAGVLNSDSLTLNLVLVNVVPFFAPLSEDSAAGYARISGNGIIGYVGDNLLTFENGRDVISGVMAHEIGHNLGLDHIGSGQANLMSSGGTSQQLMATQIITARSSNFARLYTPPTLLGDYNNNGRVDAADYVLWRNGGTGKTYAEWRSHFGQTAGSGAVVVGDSVSLSPGGISSVPEPNSILYLLIAWPFLISKRRRTLRN